MDSKLPHWLAGLVGAVLGACVLALGAVWASHYNRAASQISWEQLSRRSALSSGDELLMVLLVSTTCGASQDETLKAAMRNGRQKLEAEAYAAQVRPRFVGVAIDASFPDAVRLLQQFGSFDEIELGGGWLNSEVVRWIWRDSPSQSALPQLVVIRRRVEAGQDRVRVGADSVVTRLLGAAEIRRWWSAADHNLAGLRG